MCSINFQSLTPACRLRLLVVPVAERIPTPAISYLRSYLHPEIEYLFISNSRLSECCRVLASGTDKIRNQSKPEGSSNLLTLSPEAKVQPRFERYPRPKALSSGIYSSIDSTRQRPFRWFEGRARR